MRWLTSAIILSVLAVEIFAHSEIHVRAKRQQCKCVRNPGGGLTCSCDKPDASGTSLATAEYQQQNELAQELQLTQPTQARCACLQIVFMGNPQYQCHCGDINGNPLPTTTTAAPIITTPSTTTTTTTTTPLPITTTPAQQAIPTSTSGPGACQCIMIRISGPSSAHYQCNCQNTPAPAYSDTDLPTPLPSTLLPPISNTAISTPSPVYSPVGTINATQEGCFCVDPVTHGIEPQCGCQCDCNLQLCTMPMAVCACPQDQYGQPVAASPPLTTMPDIPTLPPTTQPPSTLPPVTLPPVTAAPTTFAPIPAVTNPAQTESAYPLTTTCVMYVGVQATPCTCLPQYDQCAQNICCLKAKYRTYKNNPVQYNDPTATEPSTIDMLMNVLQKLKNRLQ